MIRRPRRSPLSPYTTLSRSGQAAWRGRSAGRRGLAAHVGGRVAQEALELGELAARVGENLARLIGVLEAELGDKPAVAAGRSEEHTSELQSPCNIVFRLLLV